MVIKILLLGIPEENIPIIDENLDLAIEMRKWNEVTKKPILHDYHVIIVDVKTINEKYDEIIKNLERINLKETIELEDEVEFSNSIEEAKSLFNEQISSGGLFVCFCDKKTNWERANFSLHGEKVFTYNNWTHKKETATYTSPNSYAWCPITLELIEEEGETIIKKSDLGEYKKLFDAFKEENINWTCHFDDKSLLNSIIMLTNRAGHPISVRVPRKKGELVLLPRFSNIRYAIKVIIEQVIIEKFHIKAPEKITILRPDWVTKYEYKLKREKMEHMDRIKTELKDFAELEQLLFTQGDQLRKSVAYAFNKLGFNVNIPEEKEPIEDMEISIDGFEAIVEVKGKTTHATLTDLRQLLQYYINKREFAKKTHIKAIFVVNHYCHMDLEQRKDPYVKEALELAEKYDICLLTTQDLYEMIGRCLQDKVIIHTVQEMIMKRKGYVKLV
jgi:hypothetical protein